MLPSNSPSETTSAASVSSGQVSESCSSSIWSWVLQALFLLLS